MTDPKVQKGARARSIQTLSNKQSVLLVEDEALIAMAVEAELVDAGYGVTWCPNGTAAMAELNTNSYDALLTDIRMPGMDGWTVARKARELAPGLVVVYLSGDRAADWDTEGVDGSVMFSKPVSANTVVDKLAELLPPHLR